MQVGDLIFDPGYLPAVKYMEPVIDMLQYAACRILKQPVINETGIAGNFDLAFQFDAEDAQSFKNELMKLGLKAEKKEREVELLVIYKEE